MMPVPLHSLNFNDFFKANIELNHCKSIGNATVHCI